MQNAERDTERTRDAAAGGSDFSETAGRPRPRGRGVTARSVLNWPDANSASRRAATRAANHRVKAEDACAARACGYSLLSAAAHPVETGLAWGLVHASLRRRGWLCRRRQPTNGCLDQTGVYDYAEREGLTIFYGLVDPLKPSGMIY